MKTPINLGLLQSDLDCAGFELVNLSGGGTTHGIPAGGSAGQSLTKINSTDYNAHWSTVTGSGSSDTSTVTSEDIGLVGDGVTDNTAVFQAWLDSLETPKVNTTLIVADGIYIFSGPLQDTSGRNAQILLPRPSAGFTLTIKGTRAVPIWVTHGLAPGLPLFTGAVFKSTLATGGGTSPSFIGGNGALVDQNQLHLCLENMIFQTVANPLITCLNLQLLTWLDFTRDVVIIAGDTAAGQAITQPTTASSYGLILPITSIGVLQTFENVHVFGFYSGIYFAGELAHFKNVGCYFCKYGLEFGFAYHVNLVERLLIFHCTNGVKITGATPFQIIQYDVEHESGAYWFTSVNDIDDGSNLGTGEITWWSVLGGSGVHTTFVVNGGAGIRYRRVGGDTQLRGYTVTTLPAGVIGTMAYVTDGTAALAWGATVTGSGSTKYLVWYNGVSWNVMGK